MFFFKKESNMTYQNLISKGGNTFRIIMLILTLSILNISNATDLEMRMYNVGQANFVTVKHGDNALIVDCGIWAKPEEITQKTLMSDIKSFLGNSSISIVLTHQDRDHFNKLND